MRSVVCGAMLFDVPSLLVGGAEHRLRGFCWSGCDVARAGFPYIVWECPHRFNCTFCAPKIMWMPADWFSCDVLVWIDQVQRRLWTSCHVEWLPCFGFEGFCADLLRALRFLALPGAVRCSTCVRLSSYHFSHRGSSSFRRCLLFSAFRIAVYTCFHFGGPDSLFRPDSCTRRCVVLSFWGSPLDLVDHDCVQLG